jgi:hypothetical protein
MQRLFQGLAVLAALITVSCGSEAPVNKMGTPEYFWSGAKETFGMKDYAKTADHLENLTKTNNQFTNEAYPWRLILLSGLADGYGGLANSLEEGGKNNRGAILTFRKPMTDARAQAGRWALQFAQAFDGFEKSAKGDTVVISMPAPGGSTIASIQETQIEKGIMKSDSDLAAARSKAIDRYMLLSLCRALGVKDDSAKAQQMLQSSGGKVEVPRAVFMTGMAQALYGTGDLFTAKKLDQPDRVEFLTKAAQGALQGLPESKEIKDLNKKITDRQKKSKDKKSA